MSSFEWQSERRGRMCVAGLNKLNHGWPQQPAHPLFRWLFSHDRRCSNRATMSRSCKYLAMKCLAGGSLHVRTRQWVGFPTRKMMEGYRTLPSWYNDTCHHHVCSPPQSPQNKKLGASLSREDASRSMTLLVLWPRTWSVGHSCPRCCSRRCWRHIATVVGRWLSPPLVVCLEIFGDFKGDLNTRKRGYMRCKEWVGPGSTLRLGKLGVALGGIGVDWLEAARWGKVSLWCWHTNYGVRQRDEKGPQKWKQFSHSHPTISGIRIRFQVAWWKKISACTVCPSDCESVNGMGRLHQIVQRFPTWKSRQIPRCRAEGRQKRPSSHVRWLRDLGWKLEVTVHSLNQSV